jgi:N-sulfoglucosamine sulfohydrolase
VLKTRHAAPASRRCWELCFGKRGAEELYHVAVDPDCLDDFATDLAQRERRERMRTRMEKELREQGDPRMQGNGEIFERYPWCHPWLSNYYERYERRHETGERMEPGWIEPTDVQEP